MMKIFTNDAELIGIGAGYLRVMSVTYLCWSMIEIYLAVLRSIGKVTISMILNIIAFSLNIFLNAVFIFGLFGAPQRRYQGLQSPPPYPVLWNCLAVFLFPLCSAKI